MRSRKFKDIDDPEIIREEASRVLDNSIEEYEEPEETMTKGDWIKEWIKQLLLAIVIAAIVMQFIKPTIVKQRSMEPNFYTNDYLLVSRQSYKLFKNTPELGDVIIFETEMKTDDGEDKLLIKRVIGVPGDVISIKDGKVYVNGTEIDDSYTKDQYTSGDIEDLVVPINKLFCLGDNRAVSVDSRSSDVGFVDLDRVIGKAVFKVYPFKDFGKIDNPYE